MKTLSMRPPYGQLVRDGIKTIETRTWGTDHRGPILFVCSRWGDTPEAGKALCVAELLDVRMMTEEDAEAAAIELYPKARAWILGRPYPVEPVPIFGKLSLFETPDTLIKYTGDVPPWAHIGGAS